MFFNLLSNKIFSSVHGNNLVYNTCWEDPRLDRQALEINKKTTLVMITSAGCNALDYALDQPERIYAIDLNYRQNALLELKLAGIRNLDYEVFFDVFGLGRMDDYLGIYRGYLRDALSSSARRYWDQHIHFFAGKGWRKSFYFRGSSGLFARIVNSYIDRSHIRQPINEILHASSLEQQTEIYYQHLKPVFGKGWLKWIVARDSTLSMLGVPRPQRQQVDKYYPGGIAQFIQDSIEAVFAKLPLVDNYFWRVYLTGEYTPQCCPEYLKPDNFAKLKAGLADCIEVHTGSLIEFLEQQKISVSRFVLLDHMDWLASQKHALLEREWQAIVERASSDARLIWRSGGLQVDFVDPLQVNWGGHTRPMKELLHYHTDWAAQLHALDRVHTYGSFYIADLRKD